MFGKVRNELLQRIVVQTSARERNDINVQVEFPGDALNKRGLSGSGSSILQSGDDVNNDSKFLLRWGWLTYEKVAPSERDSTLRVPFFTIQEVEGVLENRLFHTRVEDDGSEGAFRTRGDETPFIPRVGRVD